MGRKRSEFYLYALMIVSIILIVVSLIFILSRSVETKEFDVIFGVEEGLGGFDLNGTALTYGFIPPGGAGTRNVIFDNKHDFPIEIIVLASENIVRFVVVDEIINLGVGENVTIPIRIEIPSTMAEGNYFGKIRFDFYKS